MKFIKIAVNFIGKLTLEVILGFTILAGFLWVLGHSWHSAYDELTFWANQRSLPKIISCDVNPNHNLSDNPTEKGENIYTVTLTLDEYPPTNEIIIYVKKEYRNGVGFVYEGPLTNPKIDIIDLPSKIVESSKNIQVKLVGDKTSLKVTNGKSKFLNNQCPLEIAFIGEKQ